MDAEGRRRIGVRTDVPLRQAARRARLRPRRAVRWRARTPARRAPFPRRRLLPRWMERKRYKTHVRILLARYRGYTPCAACEGGGSVRRRSAGARRRARHRAAHGAADRRGARVDREPRPRRRRPPRASALLAEVQARLRYPRSARLPDARRQARTLSGGEGAAHPPRRARSGAKLTDTLYCLDEPTVRSEHAARLAAPDEVDVLGNLTRGQHGGAGRPGTTRWSSGGADHVLDIGPRVGGARRARPSARGIAGRDAGRALTRQRIRLLEERCAAAFADDAPRLRSGGSRGEARRLIRRRLPPRAVWFHHPRRENNLKNVTIPYGRLTCVTGVSGGTPASRRWSSRCCTPDGAALRRA